MRFVEGQGNDRDTLSDRVRELAEYKPAAIVTIGTLATLAAARLTTSTPIVMVGVADPVGLGIVDSLARPGRNVTGVSLLGPELLEKNLDFLLEASPSVQRLAVLWNAANPGAGLALRHLEGVVRARGLNFVSVPIRSVTEVDGRLAELRQLRFDALMVVNDPLLLGVASTILAYCLRRRLPSVFSTNEWVVRGGLLSYEPDPTEMHQRAAEYVVKILNGRHPRDLPVEQPTRFRLTINAKAAGVIGLTIPEALLAQADQVI